jgi:hypothetical protein
VVAIRPLTLRELADEAWPDGYLNVAVEFDNGDVLYASADSEHNQQGCLVLVPGGRVVAPSNLYAHAKHPLRIPGGGS